jgi:hypothetical protein
MTDPDDRRDRATSAVPPQIDRARIAAMIPETILPVGWVRPLTHRLPGVGISLDIGQRGVGTERIWYETHPHFPLSMGTICGKSIVQPVVLLCNQLHLNI